MKLLYAPWPGYLFMKGCAFIVSMTLLTASLWAHEHHYWQCTTSDSNSSQWIIKSLYERRARGKTTDACKKQSPVPSSCKTDCEEFNHGVSTKPSWQCTALDENAKSWRASMYSNRDDAAMAAKTRCKAFSAIPESCFVNGVACTNLNHWP